MNPFLFIALTLASAICRAQDNTTAEVGAGDRAKARDFARTSAVDRFSSVLPLKAANFFSFLPEAAPAALDFDWWALHETAKSVVRTCKACRDDYMIAIMGQRSEFVFHDLKNVRMLLLWLSFRLRVRLRWLPLSDSP